MPPTRKPIAPALALLAAWLVPGAGHWLTGHRKRAIVIAVAVWLTFLLGIVLGGIHMVGPRVSRAWFIAQIFAGSPALIAWVLNGPAVNVLVCRGLDLGLVYTGVAGLLNLLCILDLIARPATAVQPGAYS